MTPPTTGATGNPLSLSFPLLGFVVAPVVLDTGFEVPDPISPGPLHVLATASKTFKDGTDELLTE